MKKLVSIILTLVMLIPLCTFPVSSANYDYWTFYGGHFVSSTGEIYAPKPNAYEILDEGFIYWPYNEDGSIYVDHPNPDNPYYKDYHSYTYSTSALTSNCTLPLEDLTVLISPEEFNFDMDENGRSNMISVLWTEKHISGLASGHSGIEIGCGRANAVKLAAEFLTRIKAEQVSAFSAGTKCNVIPKEAAVTFSAEGNVVSCFAEYCAEIKSLYAETDSEICMALRAAEIPAVAYTADFVQALSECRNGVVEEDSCGVITSSNLAAVVDEPEGFRIITLQRSAKNVSRDALSAEIAFVFREAGAEVFSHSSFSGWLLAKDSPLVLRAAELYERLFGRKPEIETTHGGVECGMIQEKYPEMQIISLGPTIEACHTVQERLSVQSLEETERFLFALIAELQE